MAPPQLNSGGATSAAHSSSASSLPPMTSSSISSSNGSHNNVGTTGNNKSSSLSSIQLPPPPRHQPKPSSASTAPLPRPSHHPPHHPPPGGGGGGDGSAAAAFRQELVASADLLFQSKLTWLLVLGPLAILADASGGLSEAWCFAFSGIALIPCAERLSFVTEQVAEHTNGTIGALLNATFGNAPELLISVAALRSGYYRVVQLAMLGSMLTNMIFVFGVSCVIGGLRWQVQELRVVTGNVNVVMLLVSVAGSLFPAALKLSGQLLVDDPTTTTSTMEEESGTTSPQEVTFCRVNAAVMLFLYLCYLLFQLGTHKEEYDEDETGYQSKRARRNLLCVSLFQQARKTLKLPAAVISRATPAAMRNNRKVSDDRGSMDDAESDENDEEMMSLIMHNQNNSLHIDDEMGDESERTYSDAEDDMAPSLVPVMQKRRRRGRGAVEMKKLPVKTNKRPTIASLPLKIKMSDSDLPSSLVAEEQEHLLSDEDAHAHSGDDDDEDESHSHLHPVHPKTGPLISMRVGVVWLFIITVCISAMSDILVDTIDGFARRLHISEVFTSMVIIPFFSNVAEQVSAFLFAYRNEMDLCVGVTVGSAIQIATFVLPGSVLIGYLMDRSMTLYFHAYETVCLFFAVVVVGAILQGGTTNWMTGVMLVGIYVMLAAGIWFHELEDLTTDGELLLALNTTTTMAAGDDGVRL